MLKTFKLALNCLNSLKSHNANNLGRHLIKRTFFQVNFDSDEEIIVNYIENIVLIGINLPDSKNVLTESAIESLNSHIKDFEKNDEIISGILHGYGGNFCTGRVDSEKSLKSSRELLETLKNCKKPIIASINGYTSNFGFFLALMCDIKVLDNHALLSWGTKEKTSEIPIFLFERLVKTVGLAKATELLVVQTCWAAKECHDCNLANRIVTEGCCLGQALKWAKNITNMPFKDAIERKATVLSVLR